ncbi:transposase [Bernardetia sp. OM2101]|uniref:transposase n=1 Tax=Bernardetia sp. OM2101 TaxID=3344876 RepID=UPI0035CFDB80
MTTRNDYESFKGLLSGKQVNTLDRTTLLHCVAEKTKSDLGSSQHIYLLHAPCDIRKPHSSDLEDLGKVLSLEKTVISGYSSFNSVAITPDSQEVRLLDSFVYSNSQPNYVSQSDVALIEKENGKAKELKNKKGQLISIEKQNLVRKDTYYNDSKLAKTQISKTSGLLKKEDRTICHVLDREFDDSTMFEHIESLGDEFVIRLKLNRLSNESQVVYTPKGKVSKQVKRRKIIDKKFTQESNFFIDKLDIKGELHRNVEGLVEWETLIIGDKTYTVLRISLSSKGKPLFKHPMLLLTNRKIKNAEQACQAYKTYILRFKIEVVFRFLKQNMGWETFQVRDFNVIANLLALAFFLVGYFKELEEELRNHPLTNFLCKLALSKGKTTIFFILKGLEKLAHHQEIIEWMEKENITQQQIDEFMKQIKGESP